MTLQMGPQPGRVRSASRGLNTDEQASDTAALISELRFSEDGPEQHDIERISQTAVELRQQFLAQSTSKDTFRHGDGFQSILSLVQAAEAPKTSPSDKFVQTTGHLIALCNTALSLLSEATFEHPGNQRYFDTHLHGWLALHTSLENIMFLTLARDGKDSFQVSMSTLYNSLLGLAFHVSGFDVNAQNLQLDNATIVCPHAVSSLCRLILAAFTSSIETDRDAMGTHCLPYLRAIHRIVCASTRNAVAIWETGVSSSLIHAHHERSLPDNLREALELLVDDFSTFGPRDLEDLVYLCSRASESTEARDDLLKSLKRSKRPAFFQFDLTHQGYSAIEFSSLARPFPPALGYTFAAWVCFDEFDSDCHTTLFGALDASQKCFLLLYLEKDSHQIILQTSISAPVPSVRFKTVRFVAGRWYHLALVHRKNTSDPSQSIASLFIDGNFCEQRKCIYPESPADGRRKLVPAATSTSHPNQPPTVQAFFGTTQSLAQTSSPHAVQTKWSLASAHVYSVTLTDEFLAVHYRLGPQYHGNMQDCLGPLLTYRSSSELNVRNDQMHPDKLDRSDIVTATEGRGSDLVPESRILLAIEPVAVIRLDTKHDSLGANPYELDNKAYQKYRQLALKGRAAAINTAIPTMSEAVSRTYGTGLLVGDPVLSVPAPLDNGSWSLAGSLPLLVQSLESATTERAFLLSVEIMFECVKDNWRISEAMERGNGYGILAMIIREKLGFETGMASLATSRKPSLPLNIEDRQMLPHKLLKLTLDFLGYNHAVPNESLVNNPMAYRVLLLDHDTWRRCDIETQKLYWQQFIDFVIGNKFVHFNQKRLTRMRIVKKLVEALKSEDVSDDSATLAMTTLKALLETSATHHLYRDLAQFIAYGLHDERAMPLSPMRNIANVVSFRQKAGAWARGARGSRPTTPGGNLAQPMKPGLSRFELALLVLRLLTDIICNDKSGLAIRRFNRAVPSRWLLHLLAETDVRVTELSLNVISRALSVLGPEFKAPFADKNGAFVTLKFRLKPFWRSTPVWTICFAILFGQAVPLAWLAESFSAFHLVEMLGVNSTLAVANPEILPTVFAMLEAGLRKVANDETTLEPETMILKNVIQFLNECYERSPAFREFTVTSRYVQELIFVLFPLLVGSDRLSAETELHSESDPLSFKGQEVRMRPHSNSLGERPPSVRSLHIQGNGRRTPSPMSANRVEAPRRVSSFVLVNDRLNAPPAQFNAPMAPKSHEPIKINVTNSIVESLLELAVTLFIDQICNKKEFTGIGLFLKVPPGFREHQAYFESYVLINALSQLSSHLRLHQELLIDTTVLPNLARFIQHISEAVSEGWFINGAQALLGFAGEVLDHLQQPEIASMKSVRLCSQSTNSIRVIFLKATLWRLSELNEDAEEREVNEFLVRMTYWQTILFSLENQETLFTKLICFLLYHKLVSSVKSVRLAAAQLWRIVLVQKPTETATMLTNTMGHEQRHLSTGFMKLISMDDDDFMSWIDENRSVLDSVFNNSLSRAWDDFVQSENRISEESNKERLSKRRDRLRQWHTEELNADDVIHRYEISTNHWRSNVHAQERSKLQRALQDHQENVNHLQAAFTKIEKMIHQPCGLDPLPTKRWQLDQTEAVNRMRMRIIPDTDEPKESYQPKRKFSERHPHGSARLAINTQIPRVIADDAVSSLPGTPATPRVEHIDGSTESSGSQRARSDSISNSQLLEGGFEIVDDPKEDEDGLIEDKNRKVLTRLQRGDIVQQLYNISRLVGLEACEGLLVIGKHCLYMQDNFFQRSDGEIISVSQAPTDERDPYVQLISGKDVGSYSTKHSLGDQDTRHWTWAEVLSISKRRFLFRDVSIEVFFSDGRSYLLTCMSAKIRDELYAAIVHRAPHVHSAAGVASEDAWRLETLRIPEEAPPSLGSKFGNLFNTTPTHAATKKWMRGEMSNFQYLMLINTMAGRTFNDLTQYPVFPWILADYSSETLDLNDPKSFRDFSKPMGCQTSGREAEFKDRFRQFAEMADHNAPPFHYGTHYSSAMIVSSYLIRLQPFVQSYLLLQGGAFDHADRLFDSVEKAWLSASRDNRSDVRELTPEFFYLPEFLSNINSYDFGTKQVTGEAVNDVHLPKWAKGDPHIFIAKHREALESAYVSEHLHEWIDLVFGFKQRGEAAMEATNVFQHLSYGGAKDLDKIDDHVERLATIGIIHSFGQTPHQVFQKPHPGRELDTAAIPKLDSLVGTLTRLPDTMIQTGEKVSDFTVSATQERLLASGPCKLNVLPNCDRYMQWGFADNSIRFFSTHTKRLLGLYENLHIGAVSTATFVDRKTLITAGQDCTIGVWTVTTTKDLIEIQPKTYLFGHRKSVTILAATRVFSTLLSVSADGQVLLWGLNRYNCIRVLLPAGGSRIQAARVSNVSGHIILCRGPDVLLYTINGHLLLSQRMCDREDELITCCAFYEGSGNEYLQRELIFTGHAHGITNVWTLTTLDDGKWYLQLVKRMLPQGEPSRAAKITAILPTPKAVYVGDEEGNVWDWECVQRQTGKDR